MRTLIPASISAVARPLAAARGFGGMSVNARRIFLSCAGLASFLPLYFSHSTKQAVLTWLWCALVWNAILVVIIVFDLALTRRALYLFLAGLIWLVPAFFHLGRAWMTLGWDGFVFGLCVWDTLRLPRPNQLRVTRTFLDSPRLGELTRVELELTQESNRLLEVDLTDDLEQSLAPVPQTRRVMAYPRDPVRTVVECYPGRRGDLRLGNVYLRYRGLLRLVERWAVCEMAQPMRVFPAMSENGQDSSLYLIRARQIEMQKRRLRLRGIGREFESLRDYQQGDELRNISWPATARRGRLITRQFTTERSQQVWIVLDAGRLSRTAFTLVRTPSQTPPQSMKPIEVGHPGGSGDSTPPQSMKPIEMGHPGASGDSTPPQSMKPIEMGHPEFGGNEYEAAENLRLTVTQLDQATTASVMLAEAVGGSGDKCGLLTYGRKVQQQLLPGAGPNHLRSMIDQLSQVRAEAAEANHLNAAARLKHLQRRRGMIVWVTEIADSAGRPEVVAAAADLVRRHLVLLVVLKHPELDELAGRRPANVEQMYASAAAKEMLDRRRETIVKLRQQGVLVVEATPGEIGLRAINSYLDVKARGLI